ncbi:MAG: DUF2156 domain-containing protein [Lachnospiraceae bacterium]
MNMEFYVPTVKDIQKIREALQDNEKKCCEMSPANTVLWAKHYNTEITFWEGNLIFRSHMENGEYSYSCNLLNAKEPKLLFDQIVGLAKKEKHHFRMHCIMEEEFEMIEDWYPGMYQMDFDRDDSDYIYTQEKLAVLSGKKLHGKRNHIHRFEEQNPDWAYERISPENEEACAKMAMHWCMRNCMDEEENVEYDKIDESRLVVYAIRHRDELGMIGGALRAKGEIIAITLGERLTPDTFVVHFEKAFSEIQGAYPMINREFVRNELSDYTYVNREEDLGEEGLRKAKLSYRPDIILNKGIVTEKS